MKAKTIRILGVPMDLGQNRRGVDMGPSAIRYANLQDHLEYLGHTVYDEGNVPVPNREENVVAGSGRRSKAVTEICQSIYDIAHGWPAKDEFSIFLGGDHSMSIGTVAAVSRPAEVGVLWIDAHSDFNTRETSPSGNIHGMPVAVLTGEGDESLVNIGYEGAKLRPSNVVQIGIRNLDDAERLRLVNQGITIYTMRHLDEQGMAAVAREALEKLAHTDHLHVSLDMDSLDPTEAPGVGTPVRGGLTFREAHLLMEILGDSQRVRSLDIVEINPILDVSNNTAELAVGLATSLLGKRII